MTVAEILRRLSPDDSPRGVARGLGVALVAGVFLTFAGAFGTGDAPLGPRAAYWLGLMVGGYFLGSWIARFFFGDGKLADWPTWSRVLAASLLMAIPFTGIVWFFSRWAFGAHFDPADLPTLFFAVWSVALVLTAVNVLIEQRVVVTHAAPQPPKFLDRLPLKLRGGEVWAVEAEDHYLRLHTSKGQDLILMRLADAIAELEGVEGMQVHRSWWVARDAITEAQRGDGRARLTLKDGANVPVSRTYASKLRQQGWI